MIDTLLPWPPTVNTYWRNIQGRTIISERGRLYRLAVYGQLKAEGYSVPMTGRLAIKIAAYPPDKRRRDLDNILKALLDSLTFSQVIEDDSQFDFISVARRNVISDGAVRITITQLEQL
jgi:crossover junction endodeoxyribonuclease RusA